MLRILTALPIGLAGFVLCMYSLEAIILGGSALWYLGLIGGISGITLSCISISDDL